MQFRLLYCVSNKYTKSY